MSVIGRLQERMSMDWMLNAWQLLLPSEPSKKHLRYKTFVNYEDGCWRMAHAQMLPPLEDPLTSIITLQAPASDAETFLLRSIEWTTFLESTYEVALEQATVILRYFLGQFPRFDSGWILCLSCFPWKGAGRVQVAQSLFALLPPELTSIAEPEEVATEYLHYRQFFVIWEMLGRVVEYQAEESTMAVHGATREAKTAWVADYRVCFHGLLFLRSMSPICLF